MTESNLYKVEYTNKHYFRDNTCISSDNFERAVETAKMLSKQEGWRDIKAIDEIGKIYL